MQKIVNFLFQRVLILAVKILGLIMVVVLLAQIFSRLFMPVPLAWTEELSRFLFMWFCMLGCIITLTRAQHLGISYLYEKLPDRPRRLCAVFIQLLIVFFGLFVLVNGIALMEASGSQGSAVMRFPMKYIYIVFPIMGSMFALHGALQIWQMAVGKPDPSSRLK